MPRRARAALAAAERETERLESTLAARSVAFRDAQLRTTASLDDAFQALGPKQALVGFARYARSMGGTATRDEYVVFVRRGDQSVGVASLGPAASLEALVREWRMEAARAPGVLTRARDAARCRAVGSRLRARLWDPLAPFLEGVTFACLVPDGALHLVDFGALPATSGSYLVEGPMTLHLLSTERELAREPLAAPNRELLAFGAPNFDRADVSPPVAARPAVGSGPSTALLAVAAEPGAPVYRGSRSQCDAAAALKFDPLPATAAEVDLTATLWRNAGGQAEKLEGAAATEAALKSIAGGPRVLHLATHGFFLTSNCAGAGGGARHENPLLRCGLAFAGANDRAQVGAEKEDGILTGEEAASLRLDGTEWVVLSACETAVGELRASEGVFGLRRAFAVAGARTVIGSLWPVDDATSGRWMSVLYRARLREGTTTAAAVREANLTLLRELRSRGLAAHPHDWAGFVAAGDWR